MASNFHGDPGVENIESPVLNDFFRQWFLLPETNFNPRSQDFPITSFAEHLAFMAINGYDKTTNRFRVRFFGSGYVDGIGSDLTNRFVDEIHNTEDLLSHSMWSVQNQKPYLSLANELN